MDIAAYVERIRYRGRLEPTPPVLAALHRAHMLSVPFENLDIPLGRRIDLSLASFYDKIVGRRRGGFCYELNGLFAWALEQIGFKVDMLSGRVYSGDRPGPAFDHMVLLVDMEGRMIADVGFGDSFLEPLPVLGNEQIQRGITYRITGTDTARVLERRRPEGEWEPQYDFTLTPLRLEQFAAMCNHQQTSPESVFTRKSVCSLATPDGRITLANGRLIVTSDGRREEREIETEVEYRSLLKSRFGVELGEGAGVSRLLGPAFR